MIVDLLDSRLDGVRIGPQGTRVGFFLVPHFHGTGRNIGAGIGEGGITVFFSEFGRSKFGRIRDSCSPKNALAAPFVTLFSGHQVACKIRSPIRDIKLFEPIKNRPPPVAHLAFFHFGVESDHRVLESQLMRRRIEHHVLHLACQLVHGATHINCAGPPGSQIETEGHQNHPRRNTPDSLIHPLKTPFRLT